MGFLNDLADTVGSVVGTVAGIAVAPIAIALGVSESLVLAAIRSGCRTEREIKEWIERNT